MKTLIKIIILIVSVIPLSFVQAQKNNKNASDKNSRTVQEEKSEGVLSPSVNLSELRSYLSKESLSPENVSIAYNVLDKLVDSVSTKLVSSIKEILELCLLYSKHDQSDAIYGLPNSLQYSYPKEFEQALSQMNKKDAAKIREFVEIAKSMEVGGNG